MNRQNNRPGAVQRFITDILEVYKKHDMSIGHEDEHGSFIIEPLDKMNVTWMQQARTHEDLAKLPPIRCVIVSWEDQPQFGILTDKPQDEITKMLDGFIGALSAVSDEWDYGDVREAVNNLNYITVDIEHQGCV